MKLMLMKALLPAGAVDLGRVAAEGATVVPYSAGCAIQGTDGPVTGIDAALNLVKGVAPSGLPITLWELESGRSSRWVRTVSGGLRRLGAALPEPA